MVEYYWRKLQTHFRQVWNFGGGPYTSDEYHLSIMIISGIVILECMWDLFIIQGLSLEYFFQYLIFWIFAEMGWEHYTNQKNNHEMQLPRCLWN